MINTNFMNIAAKIMVAKLEHIAIKECKECKNGIDGIPNCKVGECDLPIELITNQGKIGVVVSNLKNEKWDLKVDDKTCDIYYFFGFDESFNEIQHVWKIPKDKVIDHLGDMKIENK